MTDNNLNDLPMNALLLRGRQARSKQFMKIVSCVTATLRARFGNKSKSEKENTTFRIRLCS